MGDPGRQACGPEDGSERMGHERNWTAGRHLRRTRRTAGALMAVFFFVANPSFGCTVDCVVHHHPSDVTHHDSGRHAHRSPATLGQTGPICHGSSLQAAKRAPTHGDLSPGRPVRAAAELPLPCGEAPGAAAQAKSFRAFIDIPPTPPPRT